MRNTYENSTVVISNDGNTGTISNIGNGIVNICCSGIRVPVFAVTGGVLNTDDFGNVTSVSLDYLDIPLPQYQVAVGNSSKYLGSTTSLEVIGTTTKANNVASATFTGSSGFFQSANIVALTGTNLSASNLTIITHTGTYNYMYDVTGTSAYFTSINGTSLIGGASHTGTSCFFTSITGTNIYVSSQVTAPSFTGVSAFFTAVTGTSLISSSSHTGTSSFFTNITGYNIYGGTGTFSYLSAVNLTTSTHTVTNNYLTNLTTTTMSGTNVYISYLMAPNYILYAGDSGGGNFEIDRPMQAGTFIVGSNTPKPSGSSSFGIVQVYNNLTDHNIVLLTIILCLKSIHHQQAVEQTMYIFEYQQQALIPGQEHWL